MRKRLIYKILVLVLLIVALWAYKSSDKEVKTTEGLSYKIETISYGKDGEDNRDTYTIKGEHPVFTGGPTEEVRGKINAALEASVRSTLLKLKDEFETEYSSSNPLNTYIPIEPLTYEGEVEVATSTESFPFINVTLIGYQYTGGAHGLTVIDTFVFDSQTGNQVTLDTLFSGNYLSTLSNLSMKELRKIDPNLRTFTFAEEGAAPKKENFDAFILMPDGMHIIFQNYQVGPYVIGNPEIVIQYSSLQDILNPDYRVILK